MNMEKIKCLVFSGGGPYFITMLGIIKQLIEKEELDVNNIETFYGTSAGAIISLMLSLNYDIDTIVNYVLNRPWDKLFNIDIFQIMSSFNNCGVISNNTMCKAIEPLLKGKDLSIDSTFLEHYNLTKKEIHFIATDITNCNCIDFSYKSHPEWKITDAMNASICIPTIFQPIITDNTCYIDGSIINHFPMNFALEKYEKDEIIGIKTKAETEKKNITNESLEFNNILNFIYYIVLNLHKNIATPKNNYEDIKIIKINKKLESMVDVFSVINSKEERIKLFNNGYELELELNFD